MVIIPNIAGTHAARSIEFLIPKKKKLFDKTK